MQRGLPLLASFRVSLVRVAQVVSRNRESSKNESRSTAQEPCNGCIACRNLCPTAVIQLAFRSLSGNEILIKPLSNSLEEHVEGVHSNSIEGYADQGYGSRFNRVSVVFTLILDETQSPTTITLCDYLFCLFSRRRQCFLLAVCEKRFSLCGASVPMCYAL
jgi:Fe-S-cluster-containing hydrogenase component 2